jgi:hypothetical protein
MGLGPGQANYGIISLLPSDGIAGIAGIDGIKGILWHLPAGLVGLVGLGTQNKDLWRLAVM